MKTSETSFAPTADSFQRWLYRSAPLLALLLAVAMVSGACRRRRTSVATPPQPEALATTAPGVSNGAGSTTPFVQAHVAVAVQPGPAAASVQERRANLDVENLNAILDTYITAHDRVPKSVEEMVALKLIPRAPVPPPGKRYVIDQVRRTISEVGN